MKAWELTLNIILAFTVPIALFFVGAMIGGAILDLFLGVLNIEYEELSQLEKSMYGTLLPLITISLTFNSYFITSSRPKTY
ncbi:MULTISPECIES: hypothetical protein [Bacillus cereus group]|uniref:hypothetical protein n=1 Tax=Bacillus cereus group TaxID=86661 RepID=UPI000279EAD8|nr:hypothetical protein [Bacillus cereus]EJR28486.1 hypothetical protein IIE_05325 [Bacillus cereus VD045]HDR4351215.1 hypothetical protein [Bacillus cereus]HDR6958182.1 hypothetical protein [Bacillus cereus]